MAATGEALVRVAGLDRQARAGMARRVNWAGARVARATGHGTAAGMATDGADTATEAGINFACVEKRE